MNKNNKTYRIRANGKCTTTVSLPEKVLNSIDILSKEQNKSRSEWIVIACMKIAQEQESKKEENDQTKITQ